MTKRQMRFDAYQDALSVVKVHSHFGTFGGPSMAYPSQLKDVYDRIVTIKKGSGYEK